MNKRPTLDKTILPSDFDEFYWLKKELVQFCRAEGLKTNGGKIEISERIKRYLKTGEKPLDNAKPALSPKSKFDWKTERLTLETKITDNYKNTENVRKFFKNTIGKHFKFNIKFMNWMKLNCDKTLKEAIKAWEHIELERKTSTKPKRIAPQFEYNQYMRDFFADNPKASQETAITLWKIKKASRGENKYQKEDLKFLE